MSISKIFSDKKRWWSALIMTLLLVPSIFITKYLGVPGRYFGMAIYGIIGIWGSFEILSSIGIDKTMSLLISSLIVPFIILPLPEFKLAMDNQITSVSDAVKLALNWQNILVITCGSILASLSWSEIKNKEKNPFVVQFMVTSIMLVVSVFIKVLFFINIYDILGVIYLVGIAIISDVFAYFGGMFLGKKWFKGAKFAPKISPKKTWAGFSIGFGTSIIFASLFGYYFHFWSSFTNNELMMSLIMAFTLSLSSPYGDLTFSYIKRYIGIKDFSNIIPGHGGVFDRLDSLSIVTTLASLVLLIS